MKISTATPMVTTDKLAELKQFYEEHFGFRATFENDDHLCMRANGKGSEEIMFMRPCEEAPAFDGRGLTWCLEVDDVDAEHERLRALELPIVRPLQDNPWGDRSFVVVDPAGIPLWIFNPIPPTAEYQRYMKD